MKKILPPKGRVRKLAEHFEPKPKPKSFSPHYEGNQRFNAKERVSMAIRKKGKLFGDFKGDSTGQVYFPKEV